MIYILLTIFIFVLSFKFQPNNRKSYTKIYYFVFFGLFLFSAFRYEVGCDWFSYINMFEKGASLDIFSWSFIQRERDQLLWILVIWLNNMNIPYPFINVVSSAIFFTGVHILARRQPSPLSFLVLMFPFLIINMPMSGIRQGAAIGLICIALVAIIDKRPKHFLLWIFLATGLHASASVFLALLPFATGRYTNVRYVLAALLTALVVIILFYTGSATQANSVYIENTERQAFGAPYRVGMLALTALYFFLFVKKKWQQNFPQDYDIIKLSALGMIVLIFLVPVSSVISDRYGYYLIPFQAMIFARLPFLRIKSNQSLHCLLPFLGLLFAFVCWTQYSYLFDKCYLPYVNWVFWPV
jgi:hypothetical protein